MERKLYALTEAVRRQISLVNNNNITVAPTVETFGDRLTHLCTLAKCLNLKKGPWQGRLTYQNPDKYCYLCIIQSILLLFWMFLSRTCLKCFIFALNPKLFFVILLRLPLVNGIIFMLNSKIESRSYYIHISYLISLFSEYIED